MNAREKGLLLIYLFIDLLMVNLSVGIVYIFKPGLIGWEVFKQVLLLFTLSWLLSLFIYRRRNIFLRDGFPNRVRRGTTRFFIFVAISAFIIVVFEHSDIPRSFFIISSFLFLVLNLVFYYFVYTFLGILRRRGKHVRKVVIIGAGKSGQDVAHFIEMNPEMGYSVIGYLDDQQSLKRELPLLGAVNELESLYDQYYFKEIIIALPLSCTEKISHILTVADYNGTRVRLIPDFYRLIKCNYTLETKDEIPFLNIRQVPLDNFNLQICKRGFDVVFSSVILILIFPVLLVLAIAIRIDSKGPVFYKPVRMGKAGSEFTLFKFRSMSVSDVAAGGTNSTQKDDVRITRVGRFIRKYSLDELPQFLNVFLGDMSVVGPRPHRVWLNRDLQAKVQGYMMRHYVKPGITGWAQVNGWRGPTETKLQRYGRTLHDLWYIENWSFILDIWIIFLTVFGVKTRKNAF